MKQQTVLWIIQIFCKMGTEPHLRSMLLQEAKLNPLLRVPLWSKHGLNLEYKATLKSRPFASCLCLHTAVSTANKHFQDVQECFMAFPTANF